MHNDVTTVHWNNGQGAHNFVLVREKEWWL